MRGKQRMGGFPLPKSCSRKKTQKSCNMKGKFKNVVLIDVDGDPLCENVITIDAPESVEDLESSSRCRRFPSPGIISIDDDDDDDDNDETDNTDDPEIHVERGFDLNSNASSSKSCPAPDFVKKSVCLDDDECQVIREKGSPFKLSRCKKTYIGKTPCGKRFGLIPESEGSSSESDYSDCELMEGSVGKLREQWEKAFQKRKYNARGRRSGVEDWTNASGFYSNSPSTAEEENKSEQCTKTPVFCDSNIQKHNTSSSGSSNRYSDGMSPDPGSGSPFVESDKKVDHESWSRFATTTSAQLSSVLFGKEKVTQDPSSWDGDLDFSHSPLNFDQPASGLHHGRNGSNGKEKLQSDDPSVSNPKSFQEKQDDNGVTGSNKCSSVDTPLCKTPVVSSCEREKMLSKDNCQYDGAQINQSCMEAEETFIDSVSDGKKCEGDILHIVGADTTAISEKDVIMDREKLKQTDQYKRAAAEEWASRERELQLQAEEAQRLRKKRKAESMRLLDMERRQKERLEEMRETKKKDEEHMNLKEQLRLEVRKELNSLEFSCTTMASLLRSLGITVNGGFSPLPHEERAAYKRAVLRFHPDRASKTDIRQQVEAEEKFKLISRMREKLLPTSCH